MEPSERYRELCRLCASYDAMKMDIFGVEGKSRQLVEKIEACLPFQIQDDDRLPKCVCYRCMYNLENFYDFRTACVNAVALLKSCLHPSDTILQNLQQPDKMPLLIPEAPIVNPNAALGTPPRLNSFEEDYHLTDGGNYEDDQATIIDSEEFEMDMETNPSDFLEITATVTDDADDKRARQEVYVCSICNKAFSSKGHLSLHAKIHGEIADILGEKVITDDSTFYRRPYQCDLCTKSYSTAKHRWGHVSTTHRGHPAVTCSHCSRIYSTRMNLEEHIKSRHSNHHVLLESTKSAGDSSTELSRVVKGEMSSEVSSEEDVKDCSKVEAKLAKNPQLTILKQALVKGEGLKRDNEGTVVHNKPIKVLKTNGGTDTETNNNPKQLPMDLEQEKPYICVLCNKDFVLKSSLSRHIVSLHGVDPCSIVESDKCVKKVDQSSPDSTGNNGDNREWASKVPSQLETDILFICEICNRDFNDRASLWLHIRATHKECAAFACGVCLKICQNNSQLLEHVTVHHGGSKLLLSEQRRYSCTICGRQHDSRKKLIAHVSIHNLDSSYDPANFVQLNSNYTNDNGNGSESVEQIIVYDDEEKIDCSICYKSFPNEDHLIRHQRNAHKSEQPIHEQNLNAGGSKAQYHLFFVCELCGSSHPSKWERWLHVSHAHSDESTIKCEHQDCDKIFATKSLRNDHVQHHILQGASPNTCEICGKLWGSRVDYWKHVMGVHADTVPLICGVCLKVFPDVFKLNDHVKTKHWPLNNGDFSCDICGRPYSNKSKMSRHRKIHGLEVHNAKSGNSMKTINEFTCELCIDTRFNNLEQLSDHKRIIHALFPCDLCNKCYGRTSHLWKHVNRVHKGHEDVTCPYCLKTSASRDHLAAHISKIHRYERDYKMHDSIQCKDEGVHYCQKCNKGFHKRYLLRRHMKGCQNYRKDPATLLTRCRACERIFKDRASLQKHIENHHSSYDCHICGENVVSKLGIMTHNRVKHMDHPDLTCDYAGCRKLFRTREDLETHRKDHRYHSTSNVCDYCGDTVENKLKLKMHVLSLHRNEIGVSCGVCLIPMKDPKELQSHVRETHSSVLSQPNTCQVCGKQYASKWKAFDHTKKCHGKVFRTCKQCLAVFMDDEAIREHYKDVHSVWKDQLAAFEYRSDGRERSEEFEAEAPDAVVKEELEDLDYDVDHDDDEDEDSGDTKRRRVSIDTFDCEMCPEMFLNSDSLSEHYRNVHNTDPGRMFQRIKQEERRKVRSRKHFFCEKCNKQFRTKALFWGHMPVCRRSILQSGEDDQSNDCTSYNRQDVSKNNNQMKKEEFTPDMNIPDFNLFEVINLQLSGQKLFPTLMQISHRVKSPIKCSRKDSRKVYDESTNKECICEVCGKQWPAKKHLWQHLIRFHRVEAAVTCGVCLKLCKDYEDLAQHLKMSHEAILSCVGNNFTCKTCGRYHNARSKLLLHTSIHIGHESVANELENSNNSFDKSEEKGHLRNGEKDEGSLIADDTISNVVEEIDFESDAERADTEESETEASTDMEEENDSEGEYRPTEDIPYNSETDESEVCEDFKMEGTNIMCYSLDRLQKSQEKEKNDGDLSDDEGPPVLSPIMPLMSETELDDGPTRHKLSPIVGLAEKQLGMCELQADGFPKSAGFYEKGLPNRERLNFVLEQVEHRSVDQFESGKRDYVEDSVNEHEKREQNGVRLNDLEGAVLMVTSDNEILIEQDILGNSNQYVYSALEYSSEEESDNTGE